jgi:ApbE superfamily uncharacterized protein (UPF0280 family)
MSPFVHAKVEIAETAATIAADGIYVEPALDAIKSARSEIVRQVTKDRFFLTTMEPYEPENPGPVVRRMCDAAREAGVGPMATVAGTIAQVAMEAMIARGCTHGWVDNGGDVSLILGSPVTMEIFHDPTSSTASGMILEPCDSPIGICSSSGRLGHSISLGDADISLVMAESAIIADALATAIGNRVSDNVSLSSCFDPYKSVPGWMGGLVMMDGAVAIHGKLPAVIEVEHCQERLTAHSRMQPSCYSPHQSHRQEVRT